MTPRVTELLPATAENIRRAAAVLRRGGLVAFPTETVYGLGADAENPAAVRDLFAAKGRPADHPVIVHLADAALLARYAAVVPPAAKALAAAFWPGPMTLVLRRSESVSDLVTGGLETVGLRVPAHPAAQALLKEFGGAIAAPSANRFGRVSSTRAAHVAEELTGRVDMILDGGECKVGLESTIIDVSADRPAILRPGGITAEQVEAVLQREVALASPHSPRVPGALPSHYAPRADVEIVPGEYVWERAKELLEQNLKVAVLTDEPTAVDSTRVTLLWLPPDPTKQAHVLYARLREADELGCDIILATLPAITGLGVAIADRLRRAAGPRSKANPN